MHYLNPSRMMRKTEGGGDRERREKENIYNAKKLKLLAQFLVKVVKLL